MTDLTPCPTCGKKEAYCYVEHALAKWLECLNDDCRELFTVKSEEADVKNRL